MAGQKAKGGKKNRKHTRQKNKPSHKRYVGEMRWLKNKAKNIARHERCMAAHKRKAERRDLRRSNREQREAA